MTTRTMQRFLVFKQDTGQGVQISVSSQIAAVLAGFESGFGAVAVDAGVSEASHYVDLKSGEPVEYPPRPGPWAVFDFKTLAWVDPRTDSDFASQVRLKRDTLLAECDWTQLADAPLKPEEQAAWKQYRQDLRDMTEQPGFPKVVAWPSAPSAPG